MPALDRPWIVNQTCTAGPAGREVGNALAQLITGSNASLRFVFASGARIYVQPSRIEAARTETHVRGTIVLTAGEEDSSLLFRGVTARFDQQAKTWTIEDVDRA